MSYILDALRKSEHERQRATGLNAGLLYPLEMKRNNKPWLILALLSLTALVIAALIWWPRPAATPAVINPTEIAAVPKPKIIPERPQAIPAQPQIIPEQPQTIAEKTLPEAKPEARPKPEKYLPEHTQTAYVQKRASPPTHAEAPLKPPAESIPAAVPETVKQAAGADPLQSLPPLNITGYVQNEQGVSLAMINNQLVREGEEIFPGLRLVKILDGSAIFSYKGYVFSR